MRNEGKENAMMDIRPIASAADLDAILPLIGKYQEFYGAKADPARNRAYFAELVEDPGKGLQFGAFQGGTPLGFATIYYTRSSVSAANTCLMSDLFVVEGARGSGAGRLLLQRCREFAAGRGFAWMEWITALDNTRAQSLYDSLPGVERSAWYLYNLPTHFN